MGSSIHHIHLIAICGTAMGSVAGMLVSQGYKVTGSDQNIYPPMSTELEKLGIPLFNGYKKENLNPKPDLVIVGNAVSATNPEVREMLKLGIPCLSMPEAISEFFIYPERSRGVPPLTQSIVVAGTHGKTTTTALLSHILTELGDDPSYLIGGVLKGTKKNYHVGIGKYFVIEGDEYDTAFFDKGPKFLHYKPHHTLITSLEFDHADIYKDIDHVTLSFKHLVEKVTGSLFVCGDYKRLVELAAKSPVPSKTYGLDSKSDFEAKNIQIDSEKTVFDVYHEGKKLAPITSPLAGKHNVQNVLGALALLINLGFEITKIQKALLSFEGVKRRQEVIGVKNNITVIDDFAHHPTAVKETIEAIKAKYQGQKLWAIFEPRSNSSIRSIFQKDYATAFSKADYALISGIANPEKVKDGAVLDTKNLVEDIGKTGTQSHLFSNADEIVSYVTRNVQSPAVLLVMSNGGFGGIHQKLLDGLM